MVQGSSEVQWKPEQSGLRRSSQSQEQSVNQSHLLGEARRGNGDVRNYYGGASDGSDPASRSGNPTKEK